MKKRDFEDDMKALLHEYLNAPDYVAPEHEKRARVYWWFVGWWAFSLGIHFSLKHKNIEIHLPFGFIKICFVPEKVSGYHVYIT